MAEIKRRSSSRTAKVAALPVGIAGRYAVGLGKRMAGRDKETVNAELMEKAADQLFAVLGELKGGAMKVGQALSVFEAAIPEQFAAPYRDALTKLQAEAPPMPTSTVHRVLDEQLGTKWRDRIQHLDEVAAASASIGQVHKGVWADGREVAVKVQYPGADVALRSDLRTLRRLAGLFKVVVPNMDVKSIIDELIDRTEAELDYRDEADRQRQFHAAFKDSSDFKIPAVIASSPKVVIAEWMEGRALSKLIKTGTQDERNRAGTLLARFNFESPQRAGYLHGDPHPGNYMMLPDGRMGVIDFGAVQPYPEGLPFELGKVLRLAVEEKYEELHSILPGLGFFKSDEQIDVSGLVNYLRPISDPLKSETFQFSREWLRTVATTAIDVTGEHFQTTRAATLPPQYAMLVRVLAGVVGVCCQLEAEAPYLQIAKDWMPGYQAE